MLYRHTKNEIGTPAEEYEKGENKRMVKMVINSYASTSRNYLDTSKFSLFYR